MISTFKSRIVVPICLGVLLSACSGSGGDNPPPAPAASPVPPTATEPPPPVQTAAQKIDALEAKRKLPQLDRSASTPGPDTNQNGVRDDVEAEIAARVADPRQRQAAEQLARAIQAAVTVDIANQGAVKTVSQKMRDATHCLFARFTAREGELAAPVVGTFVEAITTNTKPRLLAYLAYNKAVDGTATSLPKGETCE